MDKLETIMRNKVSRRKFIAGVGAGVGTTAALTLAAGCGGGSNSTTTSPTTTTAPSASSDTDILNFALNLEYLEAQYYLFAATGTGLTSADMGSGAGTTTGGMQVKFAIPAIQQYATEIANDELLHVRFLRSALGSLAVPCPDIDLTNSFNAAAMAAGIGQTFNPFADDYSFVVGAFVFEDVGVTAYHGAAPLLMSKTYLAAAAGILATEAYHAAEIRTLLAYAPDPSFLADAVKISTLRGLASASVTGTAGASGMAETAPAANAIVASDSNSIAFDRTTDQVLHIVYLNATAGVVAKGGFFPNGLNGNIKASAS